MSGLIIQNLAVNGSIAFSVSNLGNFYTFTYFDSDQKQTLACSTLCPLKSSSTYQKFTVFGDFLQTDQIVVTLFNPTQALQGGISSLQIYKREVQVFAAFLLNQSNCTASTSQISTSGSWSRIASSNSLITSETNTSSITYRPALSEFGNYSIVIYTPVCSTPCDRGTVMYQLFVNSTDSFSIFYNQTSRNRTDFVLWTGLITIQPVVILTSVSIRASAMIADTISFIKQPSFILNGLCKLKRSGSGFSILPMQRQLYVRSTVKSISLYKNRVYLSGNINFYNTSSDSSVAVINSNGFYSPILLNTFGTVNSLTVVSNLLLIAGDFTINNISNVAAFNDIDDSFNSNYTSDFPVLDIQRNANSVYVLDNAGSVGVFSKGDSKAVDSYINGRVDFIGFEYSSTIVTGNIFDYTKPVNNFLEISSSGVSVNQRLSNVIVYERSERIGTISSTGSLLSIKSTSKDYSFSVDIVDILCLVDELNVFWFAGQFKSIQAFGNFVYPKFGMYDLDSKSVDLSVFSILDRFDVSRINGIIWNADSRTIVVYGVFQMTFSNGVVCFNICLFKNSLWSSSGYAYTGEIHTASFYNVFVPNLDVFIDWRIFC